MKHLVIILPLLAISLPGIVARDSTQLVYDTDGNTVSSDSRYHVLPAHQNTTGGGLRAERGVHNCPLFLAKGDGEDNIDLVQFRPRTDNSTDAKPIHLSSDITITFRNLATFCIQGTKWYVSNRSPTMQSPTGPRQYVAVGNPGLDNDDPPSAEVFRIEEHSSGETKGYTLVSAAGRGQNKDLGFCESSSEDRSWVAVGDSHLVVVFKKGHA